MVEKVSGRHLPLEEASKMGLLVSLPKAMVGLSLEEAVEKGLYKSGNILDTRTGKYVTLQEALNNEILDPPPLIFSRSRYRKYTDIGRGPFQTYH